MLSAALVDIAEYAFCSTCTYCRVCFLQHLLILQSMLSAALVDIQAKLGVCYTKHLNYTRHINYTRSLNYTRYLRWAGNSREWTDREIAESQGAVEYREEWRKLVSKSSILLLFFKLYCVLINEHLTICFFALRFRIFGHYSCFFFFFSVCWSSDRILVRPLPTKRHCRKTVSDPISCYGSRYILTSPSDCVLCLLRTAHARFLSDKTHCSKVTSTSICPTTMFDKGSRLLLSVVLT